MANEIEDHRTLTFSELEHVNVARCSVGFGHDLDSWSVAEWGCAAAGELGEACNVARKLLRMRDQLPGNKGETIAELEEKLGREMADTIIYISLWAASQGIDLEAKIIQVFNEKSDQINSDIKL